MGILKTFAAALSMVFCTCAQASEQEGLSEIIANCAGRISAELEFAWLFSDPEADRLEAQRARFVDILESLGPSPDPSQQLARRIEAKMAHASLLTEAHFATSEARAHWAKHRAISLRMQCQNMLLES